MYISPKRVFIIHFVMRF